MTECGACYGTGEPWPNDAAICRRPEGHPPCNGHGEIGHSPRPTITDRSAATRATTDPTPSGRSES